MVESEFRRWYWTMTELQPFARDLGVRAAGPKALLTERIAARLSGRPQPEEPLRRSAGPPLAGPLTLATRVPVGQRSTEELRSFFVGRIGPSFRFNGHIRAFLLTGDATLGEAVDHWYTTAGRPLPAQSESLEFNRFTKEWHGANPGGSAEQCRAAWQEHRSEPVE